MLNLGYCRYIEMDRDSVQLTEHLKAVKGQKPKGEAPPKAAKADEAARGDSLAIWVDCNALGNLLVTAEGHQGLVRNPPEIIPFPAAQVSRTQL